MSGSSVVTVLIPAFDERRTIGSVLENITGLKVDFDLDVVVVDDGSRDGTADIAEACDDPRVRVIRCESNAGKGAAIGRGIAAGRGEVTVILDADGEYRPDELSSLAAPILDGRADAVVGSRFAASSERRVLYYWHQVGNRIITWLTDLLCGLNLTDVMCGYKAVRTDLLRSLRLEATGFDFEVEVVVRLSQWGAAIYEVPVTYRGRTYVEGKKASWRDGVRCVIAVLRLSLIDRSFSTRGGHDSLASLATARRLNRWILSEMGTAIGGRVFEGGCGTGNILSELVGAEHVTAVDIDPFYTESVRRRFGRLDNVEIHCVDLADPELPDRVGPGSFDSAVSVNVLEHVEDDLGAMRNLAAVLAPGGTLAVLVPAHQDLYSPADAEMGHFRRYTEAELAEKLSASGFTDIEVRPFNSLGEVGWRVNKALGRTAISTWQARIYSLVVPIAKLVDRAGLGRGLSVIATARKPEDA